MTHVNSPADRQATYETIAFNERFAKLLDKRGHRTCTDTRAVALDEARFLARKLRRAIGDVADDAALMRVLAHNPEVVRRVEREAGEEPAFLAYLPLTARGLDALANGRLDRRDPDTALLARAGEAPAALYLWCLYSPGNFIPAIGAIAAHFEDIAPAGVPLFTSAATPAAARLFASLGFARARDHFPRADADVLMVPLAREDAAPAAAPVAATRVARTIDDMMKVFAVRAATYMNEQACPYDEEFDGNDFCAAHLIGEVGGEPAGCIRVRFFGDFVKLERLAVRAEFRSSTLAFRLVRAAIDYVRAKGFTQIYGHARADLVGFWERFGFRAVPGRAPFAFSGETYVEMAGPVAAAAAPLTVDSGPLTLIRPEGAWDAPGPLERAPARRAA